MKLKKVKFYEKLSEETPSFSAELWDNGRLIAEVSNRGRGGSNDFSPYTKEVAEKYDKLDVECEIFTLVEDYNYTTKNQSKGFVLKKEDKYYTSKFTTPLSVAKKCSDYDEWLESKVKYFTKEGYKILNRNL
jgi:hypothetical protein